MIMDWTIVWVEGLIITAVGSLLHFTYEWSKRNKFIAIFSAVNESTWEHIKLALSGVVACMLVDVWKLGPNPNYWLARNISLVVPVIVIPTLFYGYRALLKVKSILALDISIFVVASFLSSLCFAAILALPNLGGPGTQIFNMVVSLILLVAYLTLTRFPLHHNFLFRDPITGRYGYEAAATHRERRQIRKIEKGKRKNSNRSARKTSWSIDEIPEAKKPRRKKR